MGRPTRIAWTLAALPGATLLCAASAHAQGQGAAAAGQAQAQVIAPLVVKNALTM